MERARTGRTWTRAVIDFTKGASGMPWHLQVWVSILGGTNLLGGLYFIEQIEGQVVLGTFLLSLGLMTAVVRYTGFGRLVGSGHILWVPMIAYLTWALASAQAHTALHSWLIAVIALDSISLALDAYSAILYIKGDRADYTPDRMFGRA